MARSTIHHTSGRAPAPNHDPGHIYITGGGRGGRARQGQRFTLLYRTLRFAFVAGTLVQTCVATGCKNTDASALHRTLTSLGATDTPTRPPRVIRAFCDESETSSCEHGVITQLISGVVHEAYRSPGSRVEVYLMGATVAETRLIGSVTIPPREERGERAARAAEERFLASVRPQLCAPLSAALASPRPRQSPIAESLDKISLGPTHGMPVEVIAVTDLREVSDLGDFECGRRLPTPPEFLARLRRHGLLASGTYANTRVHVVAGDRGPVPRRTCPVTMGRERAVMQLWQTALSAAGAREITFHTELPDLSTLFADAPDAGVTAPSTTTHTTNSTRMR